MCMCAHLAERSLAAQAPSAAAMRLAGQPARMCAHLPEYQYQGWTLPLPFALFVFGLLLGQAGMLAGDPGIGVNWSSAAVMNGAEVNRSLSGALAVASTISDETLEHPSDWLPGASLPPRDGASYEPTTPCRTAR